MLYWQIRKIYTLRCPFCRGLGYASKYVYPKGNTSKPMVVQLCSQCLGKKVSPIPKSEFHTFTSLVQVKSEV
jgi:hypothetical protein